VKETIILKTHFLIKEY